jgi:serine/threonine protein kinase
MIRELIVNGELLLQLSPSTISNNDELILNKYINSGTFSAVYSIENNSADVIRIQHNKVDNTIKEYELNGLKLQWKLQNCNYVCRLREYGTYKIVNDNLSKKILNEKILNISTEINDNIEENYGYYGIIERMNWSLFERKNKMMKPSVENFWLIKKITKQILEFLECSHAINIAHLDIKHENIMFNNCDNVRIIDFGFSCIIGSKLNVILGTPDYIPPEHYLNRDIEEFNIIITGKEDIWALGILLLELLLSRFIEKGCNDNNYIKLAHMYMYDKDKHLRNDIIEIWRRYRFCLHDINIRDDFYDFIDMIIHMLDTIPEKRFTATQCLNCPCYIIEGTAHII